MWLILIGVMIGAVAVTIFYVWFGYRDMKKTVPGVDVRDDVQYHGALKERFGSRKDMLRRYEKIEDGEQGVTVKREGFLPPAKPRSLLILDEWGTRVFIEWEKGRVQSQVSSNLKGLLSDVPFPTERFDALREWWGEMNALPKTGPQQAIGEHPEEG